MTSPLFFTFYGQKTRIPPYSHIFVCYIPCLPSGPGPPRTGLPKFFRAIKYKLRNHSHRPVMTAPNVFAFYSQKTSIPLDSHIFVCYSARLRCGPGPPELDRLNFFRAIKYDLKNHSHCPAITVPRVLAFYCQKTRIPPNSHIFVCYSPRLPSGPRPPEPDRLNFFWAFQSDLRNHSHLPVMTAPRCF